MVRTCRVDAIREMAKGYESDITPKLMKGISDQRLGSIQLCGR